MKVHILYYRDEDDFDILGVFSSKEAADTEMDNIWPKHQWGDMYIREFEVKK